MNIPHFATAPAGFVRLTDTNNQGVLFNVSAIVKLSAFGEDKKTLVETTDGKTSTVKESIEEIAKLLGNLFDFVALSAKET